MLTIEARPSEVHAATRVSRPQAWVARDARGQGRRTRLKLWLELPAAGAGEPQRTAIEKALVDKKNGRQMGPVKWHFTGSVESSPDDPEKPEKVYGADLTGTLITVFPMSKQTVLQSSLTMKDEGLLKLETNKNLLPAEGTPVRLILEVK